jgi:hypothetical protein
MKRRAKMSLKPWWHVTTPHKDIREGKIGDFAADLRSILKNEASIEYLDPETFFRRTHLTKGLENIIKDVLLVLAGKESSKIIQIQTPFGGGKTHALICLYHLIKLGENASHIGEVRKLLKTIGLTKVPKANVAVFVGTVPDVLKGKTPWGEIAEQLGVYELVKEHDEKRITPGREILEKILGKTRPTLILIDELTEYTVKAKEFEDQIFAFCQELTEAVKSSKQCVLLCTLPSSAPYGERGEAVLNQLIRIFGRMQTIYTPVEGEEIYEILRKRLFEDLGEARDRETVVGRYFELYQKLGDEIPSEARDLSYKEKLRKAYPFHPELIDVLFERWATLPTFQRTRGVLRLLAHIISDLYKREDPSPLIQPSSINLANPSIRRLFIEHIGEAFESVIASDIAGENAKAVRIDKNIGSEYLKFKVAQGLATSIFFYSFSGGEKRGVTDKRLRLAFLREGIPPAIIGDALRKLEDLDGPLYLHVEKGLYYFSSAIGLNRLIVEREEAVKEEDIKEEIKRRLEKNAGTDFDVYLWPASDADVPDNKKLKLVVLPFDLPAGDLKTQEFVRNLLNRYSSKIRTYKNTLVFLLADSKEYDALKFNVRRLLALKSIKEDKEKMKTLTEEDKHRLDEKFRDLDSGLWFRIISTYRYLVKGSEDGIKTFDMGIPTIEGRQTLTGRVKEFLRDQDELLLKLAPKVLLEKVIAKDEEKKSFADLLEAFASFPSLPMLDNENVLKNTIRQGVQNGEFGLIVGEKIRYMEPILEDITDDVQIVRKEIAIEKKEKIGKFPEVVAKPITEEKLIPEMIRGIKLVVKVPWDKLHDFVRGVLSPLRMEEADIKKLEIKIEATSTKGIKKETIDMKVRETLKQINADIIEEELK